MKYINLQYKFIDFSFYLSTLLEKIFKTSTYTNILLYSSQLITSVVIYDNSNPACCSMASNNLFFKVSSSLIIGSFSRFKQVLAVGILFSVPDDCIQNCGFSS